MKALFLFPPNWCNSHPYLSIPCILPYIKDIIDVQTLDLNALFNKYSKSNSFIDKCMSKIETKVDLKLLTKYKMIQEFLIDNRTKVDDFIHDVKKFTEYENYIFAKTYREEARIFRDAAYSVDERKGTLSKITSIESMLDIVENKEKNYYIDFYDEILQQFINQETDIVMISLAGVQQLVSAFTLCNYIKSKYPNIKIILGGNPFTKIKNKIDDTWIIFFQKLFDYIMIYEGEYTVRDLLNCLIEKKNIYNVPNCIHMDNGHIIINSQDVRSVNIENCVTPDFTGYDLSLYETPEVILPYYIERGCYWKKCTFCDHDFGYDDCYRIKSIEKVLSDIKTYIKLYKVKYIHFVDEAISPKYVEKLCHALIDNDIHISWFTCIKASKSYTSELCQLMEKAGCVFVSIGVESCCQKVLDNMHKGITVEEIECTLTNMKENHIWAHAFMINNFEGETYSDKWKSFSYVLNHKDIFTSIGIGNFTLSKNAKIYPQIDKSRIKNSENVFSNDLEYETLDALDREEYSALVKVYANINYTSYFMNYYVYEREHLAIFMANLNKQELLNSKCLEYSMKNACDYNSTFLLMRIVKEKIYLYKLLDKKFFILPANAKEYIEHAKIYIEQFHSKPEYNNDKLLKFIIERLS